MEATIAERDHQDMTRETDPLTVADGAIVIDTTSMTTGEVLDAIAEAWAKR